MNTIAVLNQKGGVGKTTCVLNLAGELSKRNYKVLIVDCDSQGNATSNIGCVPNKDTLSSVLNGEKNINDVIINTDFDNISIIPSDLSLQATELNIQREDEDENNYILRDKLKDLENKYDFILFDCPPSLHTVTLNVLSCAEYILIPVKEKNSLEGYGRLLDVVSVIKENYNNELGILGIFFSVFEKQTVLDNRFYEECKNSFGNLFFNTTISKSIDIREAPVANQPVCFYNENSNGAKDYANLTDEILKKVGK